MVVAQQVEHTMDDKPAQTFVQGLFVFNGLPQGSVQRNYNVAQFFYGQGGKGIVCSITRKGKESTLVGLFLPRYWVLSRVIS